MVSTRATRRLRRVKWLMARFNVRRHGEKCEINTNSQDSFVSLTPEERERRALSLIDRLPESHCACHRLPAPLSYQDVEEPEEEPPQSARPRDRP